MISYSTRTFRLPSVTSSVQDLPVVSPDPKRKPEINPDDESTTQRATRKLSSEEAGSNGDERKADTVTISPLKNKTGLVAIAKSRRKVPFERLILQRLMLMLKRESLPP
jgi:hypothetical protein